MIVGWLFVAAAWYFCGYQIMRHAFTLQTEALDRRFPDVEASTEELRVIRATTCLGALLGPTAFAILWVIKRDYKEWP